MADNFRLDVAEEADNLKACLKTDDLIHHHLLYRHNHLPTHWKSSVESNDLIHYQRRCKARFCNNYLGGSWGWEVLMAEPSTFHHLPEYWAGAQSAVQ